MGVEKTAWLLTEEAIAWRKTLDAAVAGGTIQPALRDAVLNPGTPFQLEKPKPAKEIYGYPLSYPVTPDTWKASTTGWNAAIDAIRSYASHDSNKGMSVADLVRDIEKMKL